MLTILAAWLLADIITGIVHWGEDHYLDAKSRFYWINLIALDNDLHHKKPAAMLNHHWCENINTSVGIAWPIAIILYLIGAPTFLWLAVFFASFGNLIHRWGHTPKQQLHAIVRALQWTGLFLSPNHHQKHHFNESGLIRKENTELNFCAMTDWMNPVLDGLHFFPLLEGILSFIGIKRVGSIKGD